jgi:hypothetical protein
MLLVIGICVSGVCFSPGLAQGGDYLTQPTRYETGLIGLTPGHIARVSVANHAMPDGLTVVFEILNANGDVVAESSSMRVNLNHSTTFDFAVPPGSVRAGRTEVRARVEVQGLTNPRYAPGFIPSLELFGRDSQTLMRVDTFQPSP